MKEVSRFKSKVLFLFVTFSESFHTVLSVMDILGSLQSFELDVILNFLCKDITSAILELDFQESRTASIVGGALQNHLTWMSSEILMGHGVVGVLRNGLGHTVLVRGELDALLSVLERTFLFLCQLSFVRRIGKI